MVELPIWKVRLDPQENHKRKKLLQKYEPLMSRGGGFFRKIVYLKVSLQVNAFIQNDPTIND